MASKRGRSRGNRGDEHPRYLRPSERKGSSQPSPSRGSAKRPEPGQPGQRRRRGQEHPKPEPSPEAILRARARLQPPKAPWHPVPLAEMLIASGFALILVAAYFASRQGIYAAFILVIIGTLEFTMREHRHGYRSHGAVIGLCTGFLTGAAVHFIFTPSNKVSLGIGVVIALLIWNGLSRTFEAAPVGRETAGV